MYNNIHSWDVHDHLGLETDMYPLIKQAIENPWPTSCGEAPIVFVGEMRGNLALAFHQKSEMLICFCG